MTLYHITKRFSFYWAAREGKAQSTNEKQHSFYVKKYKMADGSPRRLCMSHAQGPHSHILMTGGGRRIFLGLTFWPKGIFLGSMKVAGIFLGRENNTGIFLGIVFFISSNQQ